MKSLVSTNYIKIILISVLIFSFIPLSLPVQAADDEVKVTVKSLHVRSGPGLSYQVTGSLVLNDVVSVIDKSGDWLKVESNATKGWIASWHTESLKKEKSSGKKIVSQVDRLNIRSKPSLSSSVLTQMSAGDEAVVMQSNGEWTEIQFNGVTGWVSTQYIEESSKKAVEKTNTSTTRFFEVSVSALNVRSKPDLTSKRVDLIKKGQSFKVKEQSSNWVKIDLGKKEGWVYSFHGTFVDKADKAVAGETSSDAPNSVTILYNGTNLRSEPTTDSQVVYRANAGEQFAVKAVSGDWYEVAVGNSGKTFVANWVVKAGDGSVEKKQDEQTRKKGTLQGVEIVLDPGHGGNDRGTTGARGTLEKGITLKTAEMLAEKLRAAGADVTLTRDSDVYVDLRKRVAIGHQVGADAFISLHYDATDSSSIHGFTTYYQHSYQRDLAKAINEELSGTINLRNRGNQPGNYLVLRENRQRGVLIELGFLSNPSEERYVTTEQFREQATLGIYKGLLNYFDDQLD